MKIYVYGTIKTKNIGTKNFTQIKENINLCLKKWIILEMNFY